MIFYFTGTGNSRWVAENIAKLTEDQICDIVNLKRVPDIQKEKNIGLVFPVYAWGAAEPMVQFAKKLRKTKAFTFGVATCAAEAGISLKKLSGIYLLDSCYSVIMPSNYIVGSDIEDEKTIRKKIREAKKDIRQICEEIIQRKKVYRVQEGTCPVLKSTLVHAGFQKFARRTAPFYVTAQCDGCGVCQSVCPASSISLINKKPRWDRQCFQCLRCISECPQEAIQYGKETETRGRYLIEKYLKEDEEN